MTDKSPKKSTPKEKPTKENGASESLTPELPADKEVPPPIVINAQYIKDLSFEAPAAPNIFIDMQKQQPDISINIDVKAQPVQDNTFEVILHIASECKVGEKIAFIQELAYGGIFTINVPQEHFQAVLLIECPRLLFPFARNIIADTSRDGGFPPLMLGTVDFADMFQKRQKETQAEAKKEIINAEDEIPEQKH